MTSNSTGFCILQINQHCASTLSLNNFRILFSGLITQPELEVDFVFTKHRISQTRYKYNFYFMFSSVGMDMVCTTK